MNDEFARFEALIREATAGIGDRYFQLPVAQLADAVYRERVYCYELYHQLRLIWNGFDFSLGGEVDKSGHRFSETDPTRTPSPIYSSTGRGIWTETSLASR